MVEDLPEWAHNRVTLSPDLTDDHGIPAPRVSYTVGENSRLALDYGIARAQELPQRRPPCATTPWPGRRAGT